MPKIKILHLITHLGLGGASDNTLLTVRGHCRKNYEVHLAAGADDTHWVDLGRQYADSFFLLPDLCRDPSPARDLRAFRSLRRLMARERYDIVHTHCAKAGMLGRLAARRAGTPVVVHTYHLFGWQAVRSAGRRGLSSLKDAAVRKLYFEAERYGASISDALITVCERNREEAVSRGLAPPRKLRTIYSGVELERFTKTVDRSAKCRELGLDPDRPIVAAVGRLSEQKAPLDFVKAARLVLDRKPETQFLMVGDGPLADAVDRAIGPETRIHRLGNRDDVHEILSVLDCFALSSLWEGLGRALTEAMIAGVPAAATAVDGVPELVDHGRTGLLSQPGRPDQLAQNVLTLLSDRPRALDMARAAKQRVVQNFGARRMVEKIEALYEELSAVGSAPADSSHLKSPGPASHARAYSVSKG